MENLPALEPEHLPCSSAKGTKQNAIVLDSGEDESEFLDFTGGANEKFSFQSKKVLTPPIPPSMFPVFKNSFEEICLQREKTKAKTKTKSKPKPKSKPKLKTAPVLTTDDVDTADDEDVGKEMQEEEETESEEPNGIPKQKPGPKKRGPKPKTKPKPKPKAKRNSSTKGQAKPKKVKPNEKPKIKRKEKKTKTQKGKKRKGLFGIDDDDDDENEIYSDPDADPDADQSLGFLQLQEATFRSQAKKKNNFPKKEYKTSRPISSSLVRCPPAASSSPFISSVPWETKTTPSLPDVSSSSSSSYSPSHFSSSTLSTAAMADSTSSSSYFSSSSSLLASLSSSSSSSSSSSDCQSSIQLTPMPEDKIKEKEKEMQVETEMPIIEKAPPEGEEEQEEEEDSQDLFTSLHSDYSKYFKSIDDIEFLPEGQAKIMAHRWIQILTQLLDIYRENGYGDGHLANFLVHLVRPEKKIFYEDATTLYYWAEPHGPWQGPCQITHIESDWILKYISLLRKQTWMQTYPHQMADLEYIKNKLGGEKYGESLYRAMGKKLALRDPLRAQQMNKTLHCLPLRDNKILDMKTGIVSYAKPEQNFSCTGLRSIDNLIPIHENGKCFHFWKRFQVESKEKGTVSQIRRCTYCKEESSVLKDPEESIETLSSPRFWKIPRWDTFEFSDKYVLEWVATTAGGDYEWEQAFQMFTGYCLTGETCLKQFFPWLGDTDGSKSSSGKVLKVLLETSLGNKYSSSVQKSTLLKSAGQGSSHDGHLMCFVNARVAIAPELAPQDSLSCSLINQITGSDPFGLRVPYGRNVFDVLSPSKLCIFSNQLNGTIARNYAGPRSREENRQRVQIIHFPTRFVDLIEAQNEDSSSTLSWQEKELARLRFATWLEEHPNLSKIDPRIHLKFADEIIETRNKQRQDELLRRKCIKDYPYNQIFEQSKSGYSVAKISVVKKNRIFQAQKKNRGFFGMQEIKNPQKKKKKPNQDSVLDFDLNEEEEKGGRGGGGRKAEEGKNAMEDGIGEEITEEVGGEDGTGRRKGKRKRQEGKGRKPSVKVKHFEEKKKMHFGNEIDEWIFQTLLSPGDLIERKEQVYTLIDGLYAPQNRFIPNRLIGPTADPAALDQLFTWAAAGAHRWYTEHNMKRFVFPIWNRIKTEKELKALKVVNTSGTALDRFEKLYLGQFLRTNCKMWDPKLFERNPELRANPLYGTSKTKLFRALGTWIRQVLKHDTLMYSCRTKRESYLAHVSSIYGITEIAHRGYEKCFWGITLNSVYEEFLQNQNMPLQITSTSLPAPAPVPAPVPVPPSPVCKILSNKVKAIQNKKKRSSGSADTLEHLEQLESGNEQTPPPLPPLPTRAQILAAAAVEAEEKRKDNHVALIPASSTSTAGSTGTAAVSQEMFFNLLQRLEAMQKQMELLQSKKEDSTSLHQQGHTEKKKEEEPEATKKQEDQKDQEQKDQEQKDQEQNPEIEKESHKEKEKEKQKEKEKEKEVIQETNVREQESSVG